MSITRCCGTEMKLNVETSKFLEVQCKICGDAVFVKKGDTNMPQLLDD